jgi:hypothetical protein
MLTASCRSVASCAESAITRTTDGSNGRREGSPTIALNMRPSLTPPSPNKTPAEWPTSRRNGGRLQIGAVADIKSESLAGFASEYLARLNRNLHFHIFGALAEFERALIRERIFAGLSAARERGAKSDRRPFVDEAKLAKARAQMAQGLRVTEATPRHGFESTPP